MRSRRWIAFAVVAAFVACRKDEPKPAPGAPSSSASLAASASVSASSSAIASADITSHASPATSASAGPPVMTGGSVDGEALRARNHARLEKDRSPVTILQGTSALTLGQKICEAVVPKRPADTPVLLKPNMGGFDWFKDPKTANGDDGVTGRVTDPEFVRGVIRCLKARGHTKITVAEGWGATHKDWLKLASVSGYEAMTKDEGVPLVAMDDDGVFDVMAGTPGKPLAVTGMAKTSVPTLLVPKILADHLDHGMFISIPKMKAHRFAVFSMGIKGVQGTVMLSDAAPAFRQKSRMHRELNAWLTAKKSGEEDRDAYVKSLVQFGERIATVLEVEAPDVVLLEGAPAMGGDGFQKLYPTGEKVAIGGTNVVLVDRVGAELMGFWNNATLGKELHGHKTSPLLEIAAARFKIDLANPAVTGDGASLLKVPRPVHFISMASFSIHSGPQPATLPPLAPEPSAAPSSSASSSIESKDRPIVHAASLGTDAIAIDGKGNDAAWSRATPVSWDTDYAASKTDIVTKARFLWAKDALYALFELEGAGLAVDTTKPTDVEREGLYKEDCVELFLSPDPATPAHYYELEIGPFGHWFDIDVDHTPGKPKKDDIAWSSGAQIGATRDSTKHTATIEVRIPAKEIASALAAGKKLPLGLFRMEGKKFKHYLAWSPPRTNKPNFHVYEAFGLLALD